MLTVEEKNLESSLVSPALMHDAMSSMTSVLRAKPAAMKKHITPAMPTRLISRKPFAFTIVVVVVVYSSANFIKMQP